MKTKNLLLSIAMLAAGLSSCSRSDALDGVAVTGETAVVVSAAVPAELNGTRSGEGSEINRCQMEIYLDGVLCGERQVAEVTGGKARFEARLVAGKTYDFVFWADAAENGVDVHYDTSDLSNVFVKDASAYAGNDETRDAFFGKETVEITAAAAISAQLRRPFGQLNVKTNDMADVRAANIADLVPTHVSIAYKSVPMGINLLTGELTEAADALVYADKAAVIDENGTLSMDYIFAPKGEEQYLADFTMSFINASGTKAAADYEFTNIPVQRNYRTNVSGNLLTKKTDINIEVVPDFDGEIDHEITEATTVAEATAALANGAKNVSVTEAPTEDAELILPSTMNDIAVILPALTQKLTVKYVDGIMEYPASLSLTIPSSADLAIETPNTTVSLDGASYAKVSSSTADNTLIVGEDVTIDDLTLVKGSVEVYGTVKNVVKKDNSCQIIFHAADGSKLVAFKEGVAAADKNFFKSVNRVVLDANIDFAGAEFKIESLNGVSIDGQGHKIANFKAENVQCAGLICNAISVKVYNLTVAGANIKAVNDGAGNAYAGAVIGRSYGKIVFDNCTVDGCTIEGVNKVGGMIGFVAENNVEAKGCKVVNSNLSTENVPDESGQIGGFAGYLGSQYNSTCLFENCSVEHCTIDVYMGELAAKRAFGKFIGCMQGSEATDILTITGCNVENVALNRLDDNARNYLSAYGDMLGGMRNANGKVNITDCDTDIRIETAGQFYYFASLVNNGNKNFAGKTVELAADIDLGAKEWTPISSWDGILNGLVLDGKGHTVSNMYVQGTADKGSLGVFSENASNMTVKDLIFDNARIIDKTGAGQHYAGVVMGKNYSTVTFENISVKNSVVINNWQCGGLCGFAEGIAPIFERCSIADSFVGGYNATSGTFFGLGIVDVTGRGCSAKNVKLYTDGLTWNSTQKMLGNYFVGHLYGKTLDAADYVETGVTVVKEYPEEYK